MSFCPQPKGETRKQIKGREQRHEAKIKNDVRAECVVRDGYCRVETLAVKGDVRQWDPPCSGWSEWCHLGDKKRARTRGMDPGIRHTTAGSLMMCQGHHAHYDHGLMFILGSDGEEATDANGPLNFRRAD